MTDREDDLLGALFDRTEPEATSDLMARIAQDAARVQGDVARPYIPPEPWWARATAAIGGWAGMGGLATAAVTGLTIGLAAPGFSDTVGLFAADADTTEIGVDLANLFPSDALFFEE